MKTGDFLLDNALFLLITYAFVKKEPNQDRIGRKEIRIHQGSIKQWK